MNVRCSDNISHRLYAHFCSHFNAKRDIEHANRTATTKNEKRLDEEKKGGNPIKCVLIKLKALRESDDKSFTLNWLKWLVRHLNKIKIIKWYTKKSRKKENTGNKSELTTQQQSDTEWTSGRECEREIDREKKHDFLFISNQLRYLWCSSSPKSQLVCSLA